MRMSWNRSARLAAGAFLLVSSSLVAAEGLWLAAARSDQTCPAAGPPFGVAALPMTGPTPSLEGCLVRIPLPDLKETTLEDAAQRLAKLGNVPAVDLELGGTCCRPPALSPEELRLRIPYAMKRLSSAARAGAPDRT